MAASTFGQNSGSYGSYNLGGAGVLSTSGEVVGDSGTGTFTQSGGTNSFGSALYLGAAWGSSGSYNLSGSGLLTGHSENVGVTGTAVFTQSGGTNNLSGNGWLVLGDGYSQGNYNLSGSGALFADSEMVGYSGSGTFNQSGGTNSIRGSLHVSNATSSRGIYMLSGSGLLTANTEWLGETALGTFTQSGGTNNFGSNGDLHIGLTSSSGSYSLSGSGLLTGYDEYVGDGGTATFTQSGGTNILVGSGGLYLNRGGGSACAYNLSGSGVISAANEYIGYTGFFPNQNYPGIFTQSGGTNTATSKLQLGPGGTYNLSAGALVASDIQPGAIGAGVFNFGGGTLVAGAAFSTSQAIVLTGSGDGATVDTAGYTLALTGALSGPGSLTKTDNGALILAATNTYAGNTLVSGGTLVAASPLALQQSTLDTSGSGLLSFGSLTGGTLGGLTGTGMLKLLNTSSGAVALSVGNNNTSTTYSGALQGPGSLAKLGSGTLLLAGASTYTGSTSINQGELMVNGSLVSPVTVNSGGTLGGAGSLSSVTVTSGGHIAPGDAPGLMTLSGSLSLLSGALMDYELNTLLDSDEVFMPGGLLALNGQQFTDFSFTPLAGFGPGD